MNFKKLVWPIVLVICCVIFFGFGAYIGNKQVYYVPQPDTLDFSLFWDSYNKLQQDFINPAKITDQKVVYGAIQGMTEALDDPYTSFFDPTQAKLFQQDLSGSFEGIGVEIGIKKDFGDVFYNFQFDPMVYNNYKNIYINLFKNLFMFGNIGE
ncbi:MAG: hypothetical protein WCK10_03210 [Candidatus Staskawiczbacteria bacterium]